MRTPPGPVRTGGVLRRGSAARIAGLLLRLLFRPSFYVSTECEEADRWSEQRARARCTAPRLLVRTVRVARLSRPSVLTCILMKIRLAVGSE